MRVFSIADNTHLAGKSDTVTFTFCDACGTIVFGGDAHQCNRCGASTLEHLGLGEIAARLRMGFVAGGSRRSAHRIVTR